MDFTFCFVLAAPSEKILISTVLSSAPEGRLALNWPPCSDSSEGEVLLDENMQLLTNHDTTLAKPGSGSVIDERHTFNYGSCYDWRVGG